MPKILTQRADILRLEELEAMLQAAEEGRCTWKNQTIEFYPPEIQALIVLLYVFGKRISETLSLRRRDVWTSRGWLYVRFHVLKKRSKTALPIPEVKNKRVRIKGNEALLKFIINYVGTVLVPDAYLFPGHSRPHIEKVRHKKTGKVYEYVRKEGGFMGRSHAYKILKGLNPNCWLHLFRTSLATKLAEEGFTGVDLLHWFDWERYDTAVGYVKGSTALTDRISRRKI